MHLGFLFLKEQFHIILHYYYYQACVQMLHMFGQMIYCISLPHMY